MLRGAIQRRRNLLIIVGILLVLSASIFTIATNLANQQLRKIQQESAKQQELNQKNLQNVKEKIVAEMKAAEAKRQASAEAAKQVAITGITSLQTDCSTIGPHSNPNQIDVIVNKKRCISPINFVPSGLVNYDGFSVSGKMLPSLTAMFDAAANDEMPISLTSSYRSYTDQITSYDHWITVKGSTSVADTVSARPGYSEHQTGLALDFSAGGCSLECFRSTGQYSWLKENAADYGFIERYPTELQDVTGYSPEAWHWRYVGIETATALKLSGVATLERFWDLPGGDY